MSSLHARPLSIPVSDHGGLSGLGDDDHTQYLLLANRAGGQTIGATAPGLILSIEDSGTTERVRIEDTGDALLELSSTTQGFLPPAMTEAQRDLIGTPSTGLLVFNTDTGQLNQYNGSAWTVPGAGLTTLQGAYDNDPTGAQIVLDATPNPITIQAAVAGTVFEAQDLSANPILTVEADPDMVTVAGNLTVEDPFTNAGAASSIALIDNVNLTVPFIGGGLVSTGTVQYSNATWIWALLQDSKVYQASAAPGFAAFTLFNAINRIENNGNFDLVQAIILNAGTAHERNTSGTSTVTQTVGMSFAPGSRTTAIGAILTRSTGVTAVDVRPTFNTIGFSTVNLGTIRGMLFAQPAVQLFGSQAGTENMTAYYGIDFPNMTFGGASATYSVIRSQLNSGTNKRFLDHTGTAISRLGGSLSITADLSGLLLGASSDYQNGWAAGGFFFEQINTGAGGQLRMSNPSSNRWLYTTDVPTTAEYNWECLKASWGAQSGAVGNQKFAYVSGAEAITVAGSYSGMLWTYAANDTLDAAIGDYNTATFNAGTPTIGTGSLSQNFVVTIGGNPGTATVDRAGLRILSDPVGGSGVNAALWVTAGLTQLDGDLGHTGANLGFYGATPAAQAAAYTPTNVTTDRSYDANSTTLDEVADVLGTLIADLQTVGLLQ